MSETKRVDPTVAGLLLIGFITLVFGIIGVQIFTGADHTVMFDAAMKLLLPLSLIMFAFAYMAAKCGNGFATALFTFIAVAFYATIYLATNAGTDDNSLLFYILGFFFVVFAMIASLIGAPKLLVILLVFVALIYIFFGLFFDGGDSPYAGAIGLFGILAFFIATYMAIGLATERLPVV